MPAQFKITTDKSLWQEAMLKEERAISAAAIGALAQVADDAVAEGRQQIASSGRFSDQLRRTIRAQDTWLTGLKARMQDAKGGGAVPPAAPKALIFHTVGLAGIFEYGTTIAGRPLLWLPTKQGGPPPKRSGKKFVSATVRGHPMLFDAADHDPHRKPLYIGVPVVRIPKKWRIIEIVQKHVQEIGMQFLRRLKVD
jgi:hypothetical protein